MDAHSVRISPAPARRLAPRASISGAALVVDSWPLVRAGIAQLLAEQDLQVVAEDPSAAAAVARVEGPLDLAVLGVGVEALPDAVQRVGRLTGPDGSDSPRILVLLDRVDPAELRQLLAAGVTGVLGRSSALEEIGEACEQVRQGQRVLSGAALSVLAGLDLQLTVEDAPAAVTDPLTPKEREVLGHLARHRSNADIAAQMHVSGATVKTHLSNIYAKLGVTGRQQALVAAAERGLLT